jgi:hypothetical protein
MRFRLRALVSFIDCSLTHPPADGFEPEIEQEPHPERIEKHADDADPALDCRPAHFVDDRA